MYVGSREYVLEDARALHVTWPPVCAPSAFHAFGGLLIRDAFPA
jgi:hypothetical protein